MEAIKTTHLDLIQRAINRYAWQSIATKAMLVATVLVGTALETVTSDVAIQPGVISIVLVFALWLVDGHYHDMQSRYVGRYQEAIESEQPDWKMTVPATGNIDVAALWRPSVAMLPIVAIALLALATLTG